MLHGKNDLSIFVLSSYFDAFFSNCDLYMHEGFISAIILMEACMSSGKRGAFNPIKNTRFLVSVFLHVALAKPYIPKGYPDL